MSIAKRVLQLYLIVVSCCSFATQRVIWLTDDRNDLPHYQSTESYSIGVDTSNLILSQLDEFNFDYDFASIARINAQLDITPNTCVGNRVKTPARAEKHHFSLPYNIHPNARLYFIKSRIPIPEAIINNTGEVKSIRALMDANPGSQLAVIRGVSFGLELDEQIKQLSSEQISYYSVDNRYQSGPKLLRDGLVDFSLSYPAEMVSFFNNSDLSNQFGSMPVKLNNQFTPGHVACSRTELGKKVIEAINNVLVEIYASQSHIKAHLAHLPVQDHADFQAFYNQTFSRDESISLNLAVGSFPPYTILKKGLPPAGLDIEVATRIAGIMGVKLNFLQCPFARCLRFLENGTADLYVSLFHSKDREKWVHFVEPHLAIEDTQVFYLLKDSSLNIREYKDLYGLDIGVLRDSIYFKRFDEDTDLAKIAVTNDEMLIDMLLKGRIDVLVGSQKVIDYHLMEGNLTQLIKKASYNYAETKRVYAVLSKKSEHQHLLPKLKLAVEILVQRGEIASIYSDSLVSSTSN